MTESTKKVMKAIAMIGIVSALFSAVAAADVRLNVPMYDQQDEAWSGDQLGECKDTTVGSAGCAITSIAMVFKYYGVDTDPQDMNNWLIKENYYDGGCDVEWRFADDRDEIVEWIGDPPADLDLIKSELDNRYPVIAKVMIPISKGETGHYVVVTGYSETETGLKFYINDPVGVLK